MNALQLLSPLEAVCLSYGTQKAMELELGCFQVEADGGIRHPKRDTKWEKWIEQNCYVFVNDIQGRACIIDSYLLIDNQHSVITLIFNTEDQTLHVYHRYVKEQQPNVLHFENKTTKWMGLFVDYLVNHSAYRLYFVTGEIDIKYG